VGDAVASFNPIFAQGMSVAALEALALHHQLHRHGTHRLASRFFRTADRIIDVAWKASTYNDLYQPAVIGKTPLTRVFNGYLTAIHRACLTEPAVTAVFLSVLGFIRPPTALFQPAFVARVIAGNRPGARRPVRPATSVPA
jgi:2-polyprenyl-6-methoxyphenol hydroxylase-like FAD-dependent oxidoreductase